MITFDQMKDSMNAGANVLSEDGAVLGTMGQLYVDDATGDPSWVTVTTHPAGNPESFAPLVGATLDGQDVRLPYSHSKVHDSPKISQDGHLSPQEEKHLLRYYGLMDPKEGVDAGAMTDTTATDRREETFAEAPARTTATHSDDAAPTGEDGPFEMTRSEEELRVGTELRETEHVRLVKRVVTEDVTMTVQIRREELVVERVPIQDGKPLYDDGAGTFTKAERERLYSAVETAFDGDVTEVVLYEERPRVEVDVVPIERVRMSREVHTEDQVVSGQVRKEVIETEHLER